MPSRSWRRTRTPRTTRRSYCSPSFASPATPARTCLRRRISGGRLRPPWVPLRRPRTDGFWLSARRGGSTTAASSTAHSSCRDGRILGAVPKMAQPNYEEFYEKRWFASGAGIGLDVEGDLGTFPLRTDLVFRLGNTAFGIEICEDLWAPSPPERRLGSRRCRDPAEPVRQHRAGGQGGLPARSRPDPERPGPCPPTSTPERVQASRPRTWSSAAISWRRRTVGCWASRRGSISTAPC